VAPPQWQRVFRTIRQLSPVVGLGSSWKDTCLVARIRSRLSTVGQRQRGGRFPSGSGRGSFRRSSTLDARRDCGAVARDCWCNLSIDRVLVAISARVNSRGPTAMTGGLRDLFAAILPGRKSQTLLGVTPPISDVEKWSSGSARGSKLDASTKLASTCCAESSLDAWVATLINVRCSGRRESQAFRVHASTRVVSQLQRAVWCILWKANRRESASSTTSEGARSGNDRANRAST